VFIISAGNRNRIPLFSSPFYIFLPTEQSQYTRFQNSVWRPSYDIGLTVVLDQHTFLTKFQTSSKIVCRLLNTNKSPVLVLCLGHVIFCRVFTNHYFSTYFNIHNLGWTKIAQEKFKKKIKNISVHYVLKISLQFALQNVTCYAHFRHLTL
jgi:hypothetical protein